MAPLLDVLTERFLVDYEGPHGTHTLQFRFTGGTAAPDMLAAVNSVITALKAFAPTSVSFNRARIQAQGSPLSFPTAWTPILGTSAAAFTADMYPNFISFVGRSLDGRRVRLTLNGSTQPQDADYRVLGSEATNVAAVITALRGATPPLRTISGQAVLWLDYANTGRNAYFQRKRRRVA